MAPKASDLDLARTVIEAAIRLGTLLALVAWCFWLALPFITPLIWGVIIAIAVHPGYLWLRARLGGHGRLAAGLVAFVGLVILLGPLAMLITSLVDNAAQLAAKLGTGITIPTPPAWLIDLPLIGEPIGQAWQLASSNIGGAMAEIAPELRAVAGWLLALFAGATFSLLKFLAAVIVSGILLANDEGGIRATDAIALRLVGERGPELADLAGQTVRNVTRGLLGTAFVQAALAGIGLLAAGIPAAALLSLAVFILCVVQLGPVLVLLPAVIWAFAYQPMLTAILFLIWSLFVGLIDNFLRPYLMSRGGSVPLVIILVGVLGGLLAHGLLGLFVGPIVLALGYELFRAWVYGPEQPEAFTRVRPAWTHQPTARQPSPDASGR